MATVLDVDGLRKSFRTSPFKPRVPALRGVSFAVEEGECFGLLGQNGAGKTTTIKVVTGLLTPDAGRATLFDRPCGEAAARRELGYLPENPYFHEHLTPNEGLEIYGRLSGLPRRVIRERAPALLARVGLAEAVDRRLRGFSKGMRQRFGLAAALLHEPRVLLLDEPLTGLDPGGRRLVKELILEQRAAGRTVLLCSHVLADVQELCDRVVVLHQGEVVRSGTIAQLLASAPSSFELCAEGVPAGLAARIERAALRCHVAGGLITAHLAGDQLGPEFAAAIHAAGGRLLSLAPERESLENWFVRLIGGAHDGETPVEPLPPTLAPQEQEASR